ncbi:unnamed protein product [Laminaria digitata]
MFEVAYAVHKRRSVKFCGIVFDQGHRRSVEPCSWFLRNFVRIVAVMIFVVGILVNYDFIVGNDDKAGGAGYADAADATPHHLLALLPTTGMAVIALYIAVYMWKYGNDASIVVQSTICNGWIFLFLGTLALLGGQFPPKSYFRVANESGQVLLLLSLIAIGREIGKEVQAADDFSSFLKSENELEAGSGPNFLANRIASLHQLQPTRSAVMSSTERVRVAAVSDGDMEASPERPAATSALSGIEHQESSPGSSARMEPTGSGAPARDKRDEQEFRGGDRNIDDVTRPMGRQAGRSGGGRGQCRTIPGILNKKGASLLEGEGDKFAKLPEDEDGRDARRDHHERGEGEGERASPVGDADSFGNGVRNPAESSSSPAAVAAAVDTEGDVSGSERLAFRRKSAEVV